MSFTYLNSSDRERLRQLPFPVALPQSIPSGWAAKPWDVFEDPEGQETSIEFPFSGPQSARWSVITTNGGIGDAIPGETDHHQRIVAHNVFGSILVHSFKEDDVQEVQSDWFPEEEGTEIYHAFRGSNVSENDLATLMDSLELFDG